MPKEVEKLPSELEMDEYAVVWNGDKLELHVRCGRCGKLDQVDNFKQHQDGLLSFSFYCYNCHWLYWIYRGSLADDKQVRLAFSRGKHYPCSTVRLPIAKRNGSI